MTEKDKNTEDIILSAARQVFTRKGMDGARMQEIADEAGINKSLLHYYFRSKERLFEEVFNQLFYIFMKGVGGIMGSDKPLFEKISFFVESYINLIQSNPFLPSFIINELNRDPKRMGAFVNKFSHLLQTESLGKFKKSIINAVDRGEIRPIQAEHLIANMISMCVFPFIARPIIKGLIFVNDGERFDEFMAERKRIVTEFIIHSLQIDGEPMDK
jgi:AcrR family transcriptional regulator